MSFRRANGPQASETTLLDIEMLAQLELEPNRYLKLEP
jgi:hypothetical protein